MTDRYPGAGAPGAATLARRSGPARRHHAVPGVLQHPHVDALRRVRARRGGSRGRRAPRDVDRDVRGRARQAATHHADARRAGGSRGGFGRGGRRRCRVRLRSGVPGRRSVVDRLRRSRSRRRPVVERGAGHCGRGRACAGPALQTAASATTPRRSGVQVLLLTLGVVLISVTAVVFLFVAYLVASLEVRSVIIAAASVLVLGLAWLLRARRLPGHRRGRGIRRRGAPAARRLDRPRERALRHRCGGCRRVHRRRVRDRGRRARRACGRSAASACPASRRPRSRRRRPSCSAYAVDPQTATGVWIGGLAAVLAAAVAAALAPRSPERAILLARGARRRGGLVRRRRVGASRPRGGTRRGHSSRWGPPSRSSSSDCTSHERMPRPPGAGRPPPRRARRSRSRPPSESSPNWTSRSLTWLAPAVAGAVTALFAWIARRRGSVRGDARAALIAAGAVAAVAAVPGTRPRVPRALGASVRERPALAGRCAGAHRVARLRDRSRPCPRPVRGGRRIARRVRPARLRAAIPGDPRRCRHRRRARRRRPRARRRDTGGGVRRGRRRSARTRGHAHADRGPWPPARPRDTRHRRLGARCVGRVLERRHVAVGDRGGARDGRRRARPRPTRVAGDIRGRRRCGPPHGRRGAGLDRVRHHPGLAGRVGGAASRAVGLGLAVAGRARRGPPRGRRAACRAARARTASRWSCPRSRRRWSAALVTAFADGTTSPGSRRRCRPSSSSEPCARRRPPSSRRCSPRPARSSSPSRSTGASRRFPAPRPRSSVRRPASCSRRRSRHSCCPARTAAPDWRGSSRSGSPDWRPSHGSTRHPTSAGSCSCCSCRCPCSSRRSTGIRSAVRRRHATSRG